MAKASTIKVRMCSLPSCRRCNNKDARNDEETGLYGQSALHIAGLFIVEQDGDLDHSRL